VCGKTTPERVHCFPLGLYVYLYLQKAPPGVNSLSSL
jgi:hypothetical protein